MKRAIVDLVQASDDHFSWILANGREFDGMTLAPGGIADETMLGHIRRIARALREASASGSWMIVHDGEVVGLCGYHRPPNELGEVTIGYNVAPSRQRRGFATAAVAEIVRIARGDPAIRTIVADTAVANAASQAVLAANGFSRGELREDPDDGLVVRWTRSVR